MINGNYASPLENCPTTHIIKPDIKSLRSTVDNEFFCLSLAKELGLKVAGVEIGIIDGEKILLVERFDRKRTKVDNLEYVSRIHQEDFCQALGVSSSQKYQNEGGSGVIDCLNVIETMSMPALDKTRFMEYLLFNLLVGNNDAHGKNYSIFHEDNGAVTLTPLYDVLCTTIYENLSNKMAMKIGSTYYFSQIKRADFEYIAEKGNFNIKLIESIAAKFIQKLPTAIDKVSKKIKHKKNVSDNGLVFSISITVLNNASLLLKSIYKID